MDKPLITGDSSFIEKFGIGKQKPKRDVNSSPLNVQEARKIINRCNQEYRRLMLLGKRK